MSTESNLAIESTIMAIRERIMGYFKGNCVANVTGPSNVRLYAVEEPVRYNYQRQANRQRKESMLYINNVKIATLRECPSTLTLHNTALHRSPQLRQVREAILKLMRSYLRGVSVIEKGSKRLGERDDSELVSGTRLPDNTPTPEGDYIVHMQNRMTQYFIDGMPF